MGFDWFTFVAQLVNFGLLLLLLRLFLYRPVLNLMEQRQKQLSQAWEDARAAEANAEAEGARLAAALAELEGERRKRLAQVEEEAAALKTKRKHEAQVEAEEERRRQAARFQSERQALVSRLLDKGASVLVSELNDALRELADSDLEEQSARLFARDLASLPPDQLQRLRGSEERPVVTTAFQPVPKTRELLTAAVAEATGSSATPDFQLDPSLLFGAALTVGPVRVEASGRRRLANLGTAFEAALDQPLTVGRSGQVAPDQADAQRPSAGRTEDDG